MSTMRRVTGQSRTEFGTDQIRAQCLLIATSIIAIIAAIVLIVFI